MLSELGNLVSASTSSERDCIADFKTCVMFVYQSYTKECRTFSCELIQSCLYFNNLYLPAKMCGDSYAKATDKKSLFCERVTSLNYSECVEGKGDDYNNYSEKSACKLCDSYRQRSVHDSDNIKQARAVFQTISLMSMKPDLAGSVTHELMQSPAFVRGFLQYVADKGIHCQKLACYICGSIISTEPLLSSWCCIVIMLEVPCKIPINYSWCNKIGDLVIKLMMLDDAMNWLSTLGGAYSALGDYFVDHALNARVISLRQLRVALEMGSPPVVIRCYLYLSLSLMQTGRLHQARLLIREKYEEAKRLPVEDIHLLRMCGGLWSRLRYLRTLRRSLESPMTSWVKEPTNIHC